MIRIVPSDEVPWEDVDAIFDGSEPGKCHCQRYKVKGWIWRDSTLGDRVDHSLPSRRAGATHWRSRAYQGSRAEPGREVVGRAG